MDTSLAHRELPAATGPRREPSVPRAGLAVAVAVVLAVVVTGAGFLRVPYIAVRPGSVLPVTEHVTVDGAQAYPPESSIAYTTVRQRSLTLLGAFMGWIDDDVDVFPTDVLRGDRSAEENRRYNAQLMDTSKDVAIAVALRHLGYEVTVNTSGTVVRQVEEGSPADGVLERDDVIVAVDGQPLDHTEALRELLQVGGPGAVHALTVERPAGSDQRVEVSLSTVPADDDAGRAIIGIIPEERIIGFDLPIDVAIDSGQVGGPSGGLAFTLSVIDVLTPGELGRDHKVAVTGTMALDGTVGPVGGTAQKAVAVRNAGYEVFLVPPEELEEVKAAVGDDLRVIAVDTLAAALEALASLGGPQVP